MEELLGETRFDYSKAKPLERTLHALRNLVNSMPRCRVTQESLNIPSLTLHHHRKRVALDFAPPERVDLAGSFLLRTCARPVLNVDVVLSMPAHCLLRTDHMNYHYHDKRALYLGAVARAVMRGASHSWAEAVLFERWLGDPRKPALIIKPGAHPARKPGRRGAGSPLPPSSLVAPQPRATAARSRSASLCACAATCSSSPSLGPTATTCGGPSSPVRARIAGGGGARGRPNASSHTVLSLSPLPLTRVADAPLFATPHYNASLLEDMQLLRHLEELHSAVKACPPLGDAAVLAKVWLRQRGGAATCYTPHAFSGFHATAVLAFLASRRRINPRMTADAAFRVFLSFLADEAETEFEEGRTMGESADAGMVLPAFRAAYPATLLDTDGLCNLLARVSREGMHEVAHEARQAVAALDRHPVEGFRLLFLAPTPFAARFDLLLRLDWESPFRFDAPAGGGKGPRRGASGPAAASASSSASPSMDAARDRGVPGAVVAVAMSALRRGLGDRCVGMDAVVLPARGQGHVHTLLPLLDTGAHAAAAARGAAPRGEGPDADQGMRRRGRKGRKRRRKKGDEEEGEEETDRMSQDAVLQQVAGTLAAARDALSALGPDGDEHDGAEGAQSGASRDPRRVAGRLLWAPHEVAPHDASVLIGLRLDPERAFDPLVTGPDAVEEEAGEAFKALWGSAAQLRRFRDGSILHAAAWPQPPHLRHRVPEHMALHLLHTHLGPVATFLAAAPLAVAPAERVSRALAKAAAAETGVGQARKRRGGAAGDSDGAASATADRPPLLPRVESALRAGATVPRDGGGAPLCGPALRAALTAGGAGVEGGGGGGNGWRAVALCGQLDGLVWSEEEEPVGETTRALTALRELSSQLKSMPGMPLPVTRVVGVSAQLRYASLHPPTRHPLAEASPTAAARDVSRDLARRGECIDWMSRKPGGTRPVEPVEALLELGPSANWPDNPAAVDRAATAFLLRIKGGLERFHHTLCVASRAHLDVFRDGYLFRLRLAVPRKLRQLREIAAQAMPPAFARDAGAVAADRLGLDLTPAAATRELASATATMVQQPLLASALAGFHRGRPAFGPCCRLAKRWVASHMFSPHLDDTLIELLCASLWLDAAPLLPPATPIAAFSRFLTLLATRDWATSPLVVDLNDTVTDADRVAIHRTFQALRAGHTAPDAVAEAREDAQRTGVGAGEVGAQPAAEEDGVGAASFTHADAVTPDGSPFPAGGPPCYLVTSFDRERRWLPYWAATRPDAVVLSRLVSFARAAQIRVRGVVGALRGPGAGEGGDGVATEGESNSAAAGGVTQCLSSQPGAPGARPLLSLFETPTEEYHAVLRLKPEAWRPYAHAVHDAHRQAREAAGLAAPPPPLPPGQRAGEVRPLFKNVVDRARAELVVGWDPVRVLVRTLEARYGDRALVLADWVARDKVALVWRPGTFEGRPFKVAHAFASVPARDGAEAGAKQVSGTWLVADLPTRSQAFKDCTTNTHEILADVSRLGKDLVARIEVQHMV